MGPTPRDCTREGRRAVPDSPRRLSQATQQQGRLPSWRQRQLGKLGIVDAVGIATAA